MERAANQGDGWTRRSLDFLGGLIDGSRLAELLEQRAEVMR
jgi:hypothetical protein